MCIIKIYNKISNQNLKIKYGIVTSECKANKEIIKRVVYVELSN